MRTAVLLALLFVIVPTGCGKREPVYYHVSGKVLLNGKPLSHGTIQFDPDPRKGNDGAQCLAKIENGEFDTSKSGGRRRRVHRHYRRV
jgi:hypothetical protein